MTSSQYHRVVAETVIGLNEALDKLSGKVAGGVERKPDISSGRYHELITFTMIVFAMKM